MGGRVGTFARKWSSALKGGDPPFEGKGKARGLRGHSNIHWVIIFCSLGRVGWEGPTGRLAPRPGGGVSPPHSPCHRASKEKSDPNNSAQEMQEGEDGPPTTTKWGVGCGPPTPTQGIQASHTAICSASSFPEIVAKQHQMKGGETQEQSKRMAKSYWEHHTESMAVSHPKGVAKHQKGTDKFVHSHFRGGGGVVPISLPIAQNSGNGVNWSP